MIVWFLLASNLETITTVCDVFVLCDVTNSVLNAFFHVPHMERCEKLSGRADFGRKTLGTLTRIRFLCVILMGKTSDLNLGTNDCVLFIMFWRISR